MKIASLLAIAVLALGSLSLGDAAALRAESAHAVASSHKHQGAKSALEAQGRGVRDTRGMEAERGRHRRPHMEAQGRGRSNPRMEAERGRPRPRMEAERGRPRRPHMDAQGRGRSNPRMEAERGRHRRPHMEAHHAH